VVGTLDGPTPFTRWLKRVGIKPPKAMRHGLADIEELFARKLALRKARPGARSTHVEPLHTLCVKVSTLHAQIVCGGARAWACVCGDACAVVYVQNANNACISWCVCVCDRCWASRCCATKAWRATRCRCDRRYWTTW
jgi:hypothetical protein